MIYRWDRGAIEITPGGKVLIRVEDDHYDGELSPTQADDLRRELAELHVRQTEDWTLFRMCPGVSCRKCGCTDQNAQGCIERTGKACHWTRPGLCSACA